LRSYPVNKHVLNTRMWAMPKTPVQKQEPLEFRLGNMVPWKPDCTDFYWLIDRNIYPNFYIFQFQLYKKNMPKTAQKNNQNYLYLMPWSQRKKKENNQQWMYQAQYSTCKCITIATVEPIRFSLSEAFFHFHEVWDAHMFA